VTNAYDYYPYLKSNLKNGEIAVTGGRKLEALEDSRKELASSGE